MELPLASRDIRRAEIDTDNLFRGIASEQAVLFLGAGYSAGAINLLDKPMLRAKELAHKIAEIAGLPVDDDLRYVSDRAIDRGFSAQVIDFLKLAFSVKELQPHHLAISAAKWRRVYTTNYDLVFERASESNGQRILPIHLEDDPAAYLSRANICVHLNGSINSLSEEALNKSFKLTNSSYVSSDSFVSSRWLYPFRRDLERASAIVFVGYSLYDIEVQRVLFENPEFKDKTYFVTTPDLDEKSAYTFAKYGQILGIGAEAFASDLVRALRDAKLEQDVPVMSAFEKYHIRDADAEIRDSMIERFLMHGDLANGFVDNAIHGEQAAPYLVVRNQIEVIRTNLLRGKNVVVTSDFGNGKSMLLRTARSFLAQKGFDVYELVDLDGDYISDIEFLAKSVGHKYLVVDDYERCIDLLAHISTFAPSNISLLLSSRTSSHERLKAQLEEFAFAYMECAADVLNEGEALFLVGILNNVGFWGDLASLPDDRKQALVISDCRAHISSVLLEIFETQQMRDRVARLLEPLLSSAATKATLFAISLIESIGLPLQPSLIARVAGNDEIYSSTLRNVPAFKELYNFHDGAIRSKSSLFGLVIVRNNFSATYIVDRMLAFLSSVGDSRGEASNIKTIFSELLRFSQVERLLPERNRKDNLVRYYESIKRNLTWQAREPHYWVQYAMALLTYNDFDRAQKLLDTAYSLAEKRDGYHTINIDTQQGRLHLLRCLSTSDPSESARHFQEGHKILSGVPDDIGKFRQIDRYRDVYRIRFPIFSSAARVNFEQACKAMLSSVSRSLNGGRLSPRGEYLATSITSALSEIIQEIKARRDAAPANPR